MLVPESTSAKGTPTDWYGENWRYLCAEVERVRQAIAQHAEGQNTDEIQNPKSKIQNPKLSPALDHLCQTFQLSNFERDILLACVGMELDVTFAGLCGQAQANPQLSYPTFNLMMQALPETHWSAFMPESPLRRWRLLEVEAGQTLSHSPLKIDEFILHYLLGETGLDQRLREHLRAIAPNSTVALSHQQIAQQIVGLWTPNNHPLPIIQLYGSSPEDKRAIAATVAQGTDRVLYHLNARTIPLQLDELMILVTLWEREVVLNPAVLLVDCDAIGTTEGAKQDAIAQMIESLHSPLILSGRDRTLLAGTHLTPDRPLIRLEVQPPTSDEQHHLWHTSLRSSNPDLHAHLNGEVDTLTAQFNLSASAIASICLEATQPANQSKIGSADGSPEAQNPKSKIPSPLWHLCRLQTRPQMEELSQRIDSDVGWDDLVLPEAQKLVLQAIAAQVRQRSQVYDRWGFGAKGGRGLGISALFAGVSGTGKTMAAEVLAEELQLDLYRIDLSSVVSKYIGETEKNLRRIFDAAEAGSVILLFDEADALFGKRSEVKDSHDRYANMEVSYLLQRMEAYQGLAILTTNMKEAIDTAFLRRIRFIVKFPFPDAPQREEIWRKVFPQTAPVEALDVTKLARLNVAGGNIRNIALNAAFLAADGRQAIAMKHILEAAKAEYAKLERTLTDAEVRGWILET